MEGYVTPFVPYPMMPPANQDHGDTIADYYNMQPLNIRNTSPPKHRPRHRGKRSRSASDSRSRSKSRSKSRSRSRSGSRSRSRSFQSTRSARSLRRGLNFRDPSFLDAFRVLYLTCTLIRPIDISKNLPASSLDCGAASYGASTKSKKSTTKYLATKKRQDHIEEILKSDGLGSKRWLFYPRASTTTTEPNAGKVAGARDNSDQRIKIDGQFFRKYKRGKNVDVDAPIAKLMRWELMFYKRLGFIRTD